MDKKLNIKKQRKISKEATPGPWVTENCSDVFVDVNKKGEESPANDAFQVADFNIHNPVEIDGENCELAWEEQKANASFTQESRNNYDLMLDLIEAAIPMMKEQRETLSTYALQTYDRQGVTRKEIKKIDEWLSKIETEEQ